MPVPELTQHLHLRRKTAPIRRRGTVSVHHTNPRTVYSRITICITCLPRRRGGVDDAIIIEVPLIGELVAIFICSRAREAHGERSIAAGRIRTERGYDRPAIDADVIEERLRARPPLAGGST